MLFWKVHFFENELNYYNSIQCHLGTFQPMDQTVINYVRRGNLKGLKRAFENGYILKTPQLCNIAASEGRFACLKWLHSIDCVWG